MYKFLIFCVITLYCTFPVLSQDPPDLFPVSQPVPQQVKQEKIEWVLMKFTADWCLSCKRLDNLIDTKPGLKEAYNKFNKISVVDLTDRATNTDLVRTWNVKFLPTIIVCTLKDGVLTEVKRVVGHENSEPFINLVKQTLELPNGR